MSDDDEIVLTPEQADTIQLIKRAWARGLPVEISIGQVPMLEGANSDDEVTPPLQFRPRPPRKPPT